MQVNNFASKKDPALFSQGRANFSGKGRENSLPPQQREFVSGDVGFPIKAIAVLLYCPTKPYSPIQEMALKKLKTLPPTIYTFSIIFTLFCWARSLRSLALILYSKMGF